MKIKKGVGGEQSSWFQCCMVGMCQGGFLLLFLPQSLVIVVFDYSECVNVTKDCCKLMCKGFFFKVRLWLYLLLSMLQYCKRLLHIDFQVV
jgi:hypothetical protein